MVERLDGAYIHDDWDGEKLLPEPGRIADRSNEG